jgi:hypothetical protein
MGRPKQVLLKRQFSGVPLYADYARTEKCEFMHIHWRDLRILMTQAQFKAFCEMIIRSYEKWDGELSPDEDILLECPTMPESIVFEGEGLIEEQHGELFHVHYGDLRLELQPQTFLMMARMFEQAKRKYNEQRVVMIPAEDINPYDPGHFENREEWLAYDKLNPDRDDDYWEHRSGIELIKRGLMVGKKMRPISVIEIDHEKYKYQRLDGFKRFMAWKEFYRREDRVMIPCYIEEGNVTPGCQDGQPWFLE